MEYRKPDPETAVVPDAPVPATTRPEAARPARELDARLDEELDETFPASDPIPYRHDA